MSAPRDRAGRTTGGFVDVPDYWVRQEADDILLDMAKRSPAALADEFERTCANFDGGDEMAAAIVAELRRRAAAYIRFWPGPTPVEMAADARKADGVAAVDFGDLSDDDIPW